MYETHTNVRISKDSHSAVIEHIENYLKGMGKVGKFVEVAIAEKIERDKGINEFPTLQRGFDRQPIQFKTGE